MAFIAFHTDVKSSCPFDVERAKLQGKVVEVNILSESRSVCLVETLDKKLKVMFSKWPGQYWGKQRGVFKTRAEAQEYLEKPSPKFDQDGHLINKISKSDQ